MKRTNLLLAFAAFASSAFAAYTPYYSDPLTSPSSTYWTFSGGSLISKVAVPDGTSSYDVKATVNTWGNQARSFFERALPPM